MTLYKNVSKAISILILSAIVMVTPLMAKDQKKTIALSGGSTLNGTVLRDGDYTVVFSDSEAGDATISRNGKVILRTPYHLVALSGPSKQTEVHSRVNSDGTKEITSMVFNRFSVEIVFAE
jgi:6-phosphogluconolactonase/glucosamine-6-phosphate isomerase/deaminase